MVDGCVAFVLLLRSENMKNHPLPPKKVKELRKVSSIFYKLVSPHLLTVLFLYYPISHPMCVFIAGAQPDPCLNSSSSLPSFPETRPKKKYELVRGLTTHKTIKLKLCLQNSSIKSVNFLKQRGKIITSRSLFFLTTF